MREFEKEERNDALPAAAAVGWMRRKERRKVPRFAALRQLRLPLRLESERRAEEQRNGAWARVSSPAAAVAKLQVGRKRRRSPWDASISSLAAAFWAFWAQTALLPLQLSSERAGESDVY